MVEHDDGNNKILDEETADTRRHRVDSYTLAYLTCPQDSAKNYLGALLITNSRSHPLHFAYVSPVRPTILQRILYGGTLDEHVKTDVIVKKLFGDGLDIKPNVVFVDSGDLLSARRIINLPVAQLSKKSNSQNDTSSLSAFRFETDGNGNDERFVGKIIARLEQVIDLYDPFDRMTEALKETLKSKQAE